jgi:cytochrome b561
MASRNSNQGTTMLDMTYAGGKPDHLALPMEVPATDVPALRLPVVISMGHARSVPAYTATARILHWLTAILIFSMIPLGLVISNDWGGPLQDFLYDLHRSIGALIVPLILLRLLCRWAKPPSRLPDDIPTIQRFAAHATHWLLYALLIGQPMVGWMATSAYGAPIKVLGWLELPQIWTEDRQLAEQLFSIHRLIGLVIVGLVAAHIGAALFHHLVRKDRILMRMISG